MPNSLNSRLLVTGAGGQLGRRTAELLLDQGATALTVASRDPAKLAALAARGAKTQRADFNDPASLDAAFKGIERLLVISGDDILTPGTRQRQHKAAVDAAVRAGVKHIVYTSMPNPEPGSLIPFAPDHYETEQAIARSGIPYTILRVNWYAENLLRSLPQSLASGQWYTAAGDGRVGHVAREDVARTAAAALAAAPAASVTLDVTGPEAVTVHQIAAWASEAAAKPLAVVPVSDEQLRAGMAQAGLPPPIVALFAAFDANTRAGKVDITSDTVQKLTGKAPQPLREFLLAKRAALSAAPAGH
jgi:NAD(P)H dehydrogenase (quinone)